MPPSPATPVHVPVAAVDDEDRVVVSPLVVAPTQSGSIGTPLFVPCPSGILPTPNSTPPRPPTILRKTLASATGLNLVRSNPRLQVKNRDMPIALMVERILCQCMGMVDEGEMVTEAAIAKYVALFRGQLPDLAVGAL